MVFHGICIWTTVNLAPSWRLSNKLLHILTVLLYNASGFGIVIYHNWIQNLNGNSWSRWNSSEFNDSTKSLHTSQMTLDCALTVANIAVVFSYKYILVCLFSLNKLIFGNHNKHQTIIKFAHHQKTTIFLLNWISWFRITSEIRRNEPSFFKLLWHTPTMHPCICLLFVDLEDTCNLVWSVSNRLILIHTVGASIQFLVTQAHAPMTYYSEHVVIPSIQSS